MQRPSVVSINDDFNINDNMDYPKPADNLNNIAEAKES